MPAVPVYRYLLLERFLASVRSQDMSVKECIVKELVAAEKPLKSTFWGSKVLQRTGADAYKRDAEQWR